MKKIRQILCLTLSMIMLVSVFTFANAETSGLQYTQVEGGVEVSGYIGTDVSVEIPAQYGGQNVVSIAPAVFSNKNITEIKIGENVASIGAIAFSNCNELERVWILNDDCDIDDTAFEGLEGLLFIGGTSSNARRIARELGAEFTDQPIESVEMSIDKSKRFIYQGDDADISGAFLTADYKIGADKKIALDQSMLEGLDTDEAGYKAVTIDVDGYYDFNTYFIVLGDPKPLGDVEYGYWANTAINNCLRAEIFYGDDTNNTFGVKDNITRAEFAQMIYNTYKNDSSVMTETVKDVSFSDVSKNKWYYEAIDACAKAGIISGMGDGTYSPDAYISRQDAAIIMMNIIVGKSNLDEIDVDETLKAAQQSGIKAGDFDKVSNYAKKAMAASLGIIFFGDENGNLNPKSSIIRAECASIMNSYFFDGYVRKRLVYLSPSNQMSNPYTGYDTSEGEQMNIVGKEVQKRLIEMGYEVVFAEVSRSISDRGVDANNMGCDAYVAIHSNAAGRTNNGEYHGTLGFYNGQNTGAKLLSEYIYNNVSKLTPTSDRGISDDMKTERPYIEVRVPQMANLLLEVEFHDYKEYAKWIMDNTEGLGSAIADGIDKYLKTL